MRVVWIVVVKVVGEGERAEGGPSIVVEGVKGLEGVE